MFRVRVEGEAWVWVRVMEKIWERVGVRVRVWQMVRVGIRITYFATCMCLFVQVKFVRNQEKDKTKTET